MPTETQWLAFLSTVEKMRAAQKRYFRHKDNLQECKGLEAAVDGQADLLSGRRGPGLFDREDAS